MLRRSRAAIRPGLVLLILLAGFLLGSGGTSARLPPREIPETVREGSIDPGQLQGPLGQESRKYSA